MKDTAIKERPQDEPFKEAPIIDRLHINLDDSQTKTLNAWIEDKKNAVGVDRQGFMDRHKDFLSNFDDFITKGRKGQWEESANYHMPLTLIMVNSYVARLYNILTSGNVVSYTPREGSDETMVNAVKMLREWYMYDYLNNYRGIKGFTLDFGDH